MSHRAVSLEKLVWGHSEALLGMTYAHPGLPKEVLEQPDHVGISVPGTRRFLDFVMKQVLPSSREAVAVETATSFELNSRLRSPIELHAAGDADRVRVFERDKDSHRVRVDYLAFWVEDIDAAAAAVESSTDLRVALLRRAVQPYVLVSDRKHPNLLIRLLDHAQEYLVRQQLLEGQASSIDLTSENPGIDLYKNNN